MINEAFDDDIPDDTDYTEPAPESVERPAGQFKRMLNDREIWFKPPIHGQFAAFKRYRETLAARYEVLSVKARKKPSVETLEQIRELAERIDMATLEFFEGILADPDDADWVALEMIGGRVTVTQIHNVLFVDDDPDDDTVVPAPAKKPAKKAANASRTRR